LQYDYRHKGGQLLRFELSVYRGGVGRWKDSHLGQTDNQPSQGFGWGQFHRELCAGTPHRPRPGLQRDRRRRPAVEPQAGGRH